ncbi:hypothetical protein ACFL29_00920 [Patescibacteria group bacterium]
MKKKDKVDQFAEFAGSVVRQLPRDLTNTQMQRWIKDQRALRNALQDALAQQQMIKIDRKNPFVSEEFLGKGWKILEQDERSLALTEINLADVRLLSMLKDNETRIKGEEKLERLKEAGHIRLDAKIFQILWENQELIPELWKEKTNGCTTYIFFDGTILRHSHGLRCVLCLCWLVSEWHWDYSWLESDWFVDDSSVVLAR